MLYCTQCGKANAENANFCFSCGQPMVHKNAETQKDSSDSEKSISSADTPALMVAAQPEAGKSSSYNFIAKHWRGEYSLGVAYWLFGFLIAIFVAVLSFVFEAMGDSLNLSGRAYGFLILIYYAVIVGVSLWQIVGVIRSASAHTSRGGKQLWATLALLMVCLGAFRLFASFIVDGLPLVREGVNMIRGADNIPDYSLRLMRNDTELEMAGGIPIGTTEAVRKILDSYPSIRVIHLNSTGGRIVEANKLAILISMRQLITYTRTSCVSACTIAFLAGRERYLGEQGRIGFHSASIGGVTGSDELNVNSSFKAALSRVGASPSFITKATATSPQDIWFPDTEQLKQQNIITAVVDSSQFGLSGVTEWRDANAIEQSLLKQPVFSALSNYDSDNYLKLKKVVVEGVQHGRSSAEIQGEIQVLISSQIVPKYLVRAPDQALIRYWRSQVAEMNFFVGADPKGCVAFIGLDSTYSKFKLNAMIPKELAGEDLAALADVIKQTAANPVQPKPISIYQKELEAVFLAMMKKSRRSVEVVANPDRFLSDPAAVCSGLILMYDTILTLKDPKVVGGLLRSLAQEAEL
ncbi:zinc-ribbon domain-containing protein [Pseudomonas putida]|uniref:zinc-ribbon domain-containing protein n=1 Tax=Pseudomonas putida TaxID=303 RepID=UPI0021AB42D7|nr:zinc-ribbon domain-containing protein [Pseudomonas putida]HDS1061056.1 zinc-ribbon domain-containing protein [Pseudomonas putida]